MKSTNVFTLSSLALACGLALSSPAYSAEAETEVKTGGGVKFAKEDGSLFEVGGRLMLDWDQFDGAHNFSADGDSISDSEFRRARMYIKGQIAKNWEGKLQVNYDDADGDVNLEDAYARYKGFSFADVTIGQMKEPFGLEELTSSKDITAIERTMGTNAFAPGRSRGITLHKGADHYSWGFGVYDSEKDDDDGDIDYAYTGRVTFAPINNDGTVLHFGGAFSHRELDGVDNTYQIRERAEVHLADRLAVSAETDADAVDVYGLEAAFATGPFHVQSEYFMSEVDANAGDEDADYDGYYVQAGWVVTGESRPYSKGVFKRIKPGANGAWEVFGRFSNLNADDNGEGTEVDNWTLGVNYYINNAIRVGLNYISTEVDGSDVLALNGEEDGDALSMRFQYVF